MTLLAHVEMWPMLLYLVIYDNTYNLTEFETLQVDAST